MNAQLPEPPELFDVEIEQALLGGVMTDNQGFWRVENMITSFDFYDPMHGRLWLAISKLKQRNEIATPLTLKGFAETDEGLSSIGGVGYLKSIAQGAPILGHVAEYARQIVDFAKRRALLRTAHDLIDSTYNDRDVPAPIIADRASEALYDAAHSEEQGDGPEEIGALMLKAAQAAEDARNHPERTHILTGLAPLDKALGGLFPRDLTTLGAAPNMGKTGLVQQIALAAARNGKRVLFFSLEMGALEISTRYAASEAGASADKIEQGRISDAEMDKLALAPERYLDLPLSIDGTANLSVAQMRARCHALRRRKGGLDLAVIDHLRFITPADRRDDEKDQIQQITKDLKTLAKEMNIAVLLVAHLNRDFWKRQSKRPVTSDLYGSSAIEQNADHIWFLHREEYYLERDAPDGKDKKTFDAWLEAYERSKGWAEVFSAKRRRGPVGSARLRFDAPFVRFLDPALEEPKVVNLFDYQRL